MNTWRCLLPMVILVILAPVPACAAPGRAEPLVTNFGLGTFLHPIQKPPIISYPPWCQAQPFACCKDHVYIFGINGLNVLCSGNFNGLLSYVRSQGFTNTHFVQFGYNFCSPGSRYWLDGLTVSG